MPCAKIPTELTESFLRVLAKLLAIASARSIPRIYDDTLAANRAMLALGKSMGFRLVRHPHEAYLTRMVRGLR